MRLPRGFSCYAPPRQAPEITPLTVVERLLLPTVRLLPPKNTCPVPSTEPMVTPGALCRLMSMNKRALHLRPLLLLLLPLLLRLALPLFPLPQLAISPTFLTATYAR